jgi:hypothetical protein
MKRKRIDFSFEDVIKEMVQVANLIDEEITNNFSSNFYLVALGLENIPEKKNEGEIFTYDDIENTRIGFDIYLAYEYAESRIWHKGDATYSVAVWLNELEQFHKFIGHIITKLEESKFTFLLELCIARNKFDNGNDLTFKDIAYLCGIDERSVRNAASLDESEIVNNNKQRKLRTEKVNGITVIKHKDAEDWIGWKRFKFTNAVNIPSHLITKKKTIEQIATQSEFREFIINQLDDDYDDYYEDEIRSKKLVLESVESSINLIKRDRSFSLSIAALKLLSEALKIDADILCYTHMKVFHYETLLFLKTKKIINSNAQTIKEKLDSLRELKNTLNLGKEEK